MSRSIYAHQVSWHVPKPLYGNLQKLQESLKGADGRAKWDSVESLAIHFLAVAVKEAYKELEVKAQQSRLIQPAMIQPSIILPRGR